MAWRNRISIKSRSSGFRKMNSGKDEDYDSPLLVSSIASLSPKSNSSPTQIGLGFGVFQKNGNNGSYDMHSNIAAVPDEIEALSFPEPKQDKDLEDKSPVSTVEHKAFVAQFDPNMIGIIEDKGDSATATVFDDDTSHTGSIYHEESEVKSLRPPSIIAEGEEDGEKKARDESTKSTANISSKNSKSSHKSNGESDERLSSSTRERSKYIDEDADAATWKADEIDAFVEAVGFGTGEGQPVMEITGVDLLHERDNTVNELQEVNHLMTFNALVLIQKQKDWIEGSIDATKGASKGGSNLLTMELENLERKIKLLMDNKAWPNETERRKQEKNPFTPAKAFFKSMALIDRSIEQFHKSYLKYMSKNSEENHKLKERIEELVKLNDSLKEEVVRSNQKTETIRNLQKERDDLTRTVERNDDKLASLLANDELQSISNKRECSKFHSVKSYIHRLETERKGHLAEIQLLKSSVHNSADGDDTASVASTEIASNLCAIAESVMRKEVQDDASSVKTDTSDDGNILDDDLGSKWNTLERNELAMADKEEQIKRLSDTVAGQGSSLESVRAECKAMKEKILELETSRNEYKSQCEIKDSALQISQDRISSLEVEVLDTHAQCATYEEDYQALRQSFASQKVATKQEITDSQDEVKAQVEQIREEFKEKLKKSEEQMQEAKEDNERIVRDLKASVEEVEAERDTLQARLAETSVMLPSSTMHAFNDEKKESDAGDTVEWTSSVVVSPKSTGETDLEQMQSRFAEKASKQAFKIAQLTEENEVKDEQLKSLQEMVEMLLSQRNGEGDKNGEGKNRQWGRRFSKMRAASQQRASDILNRSRHGSRHGGSMHGSQHGMTN